MPKTKRGHHTTKRRTKPRAERPLGAPTHRYKPCGERMKYALPAELENKIPL
jgi:hypothetical protein